MLNKVLLPVDFTEGNRVAIENSGLKSELEIKELILLNVIDESIVEELLNGYSMLYSNEDKELQNVIGELEKKSKEKLQNLSEKVGKFFNVRTVSVILKVGIPYKEICKTAEEEKVSLILIPTHGKMSYSKEIFGSTCIRVLKTTNKPVLILHSRREGGK